VTRVKICGVNSAEAFDAAVEAGADWIGFVFFEGSPRFVTPAAAGALSARRAGGPARVGLFVDPSDDALSAALDSVRLDVLQIYAPVARVADVASRFGVPVWRCCAVNSAADLPRDAGAARAVVIEARAPAEAGRPGGNGIALDWAVLRGWKPGFDWVLAGGLTVANVARAVALTGAPAVDVSSGVEVAAGVKSGALVRAFVAAARVGWREDDAGLPYNVSMTTISRLGDVR
jgi:phosphoribosylanthranilate isomerase